MMGKRKRKTFQRAVAGVSHGERQQAERIRLTPKQPPDTAIAEVGADGVPPLQGKGIVLCPWGYLPNKSGTAWFYAASLFAETTVFFVFITPPAVRYPRHRLRVRFARIFWEYTQ